MEKKFVQSRPRKYRKSSQNYESAIQKQLNDDFQVFDYLNKNKLQGNNIDDYLRLFNSLQVIKNNKKQKYQALQVNYLQMSADIFENIMPSSEEQVWKAQKDQFLFQHEQILMKTANQEQVKNNLDQQIIQTMKSLNLLKGDIGHLVNRNESAKLLSSKIAKVKIVADDQLKRVTMAHLKDKDQLKLRGQMQKSFNSKLQNVSLFEDSSLAGLKKKYLTAMVRKKEIYNKLNLIQKVRDSINRSEDRQQQKNLINRRTLQLYRYFVKVKNLIEAVPALCKNMGDSSQEIGKFVEWIKQQQNYKDDIGHQQNIFGRTGFSRSQQKKKSLFPSQHPIDCLNSSDLQQISRQTLSSMCYLIESQHYSLCQQIQKQIQLYNIQMKKNKQLVAQLQKYDQEIASIQSDFIRENNLMFVVAKQDRQQYNYKLRQFIQFLKTIFTLLEYVEKNLNYSNFPMQSQHKTQKNIKRQTKLALDGLNIQECNQKISSEQSLLWVNKSYISQLYKTYYILLKDQSESKLDTIQDNIYSNLKEDIQGWLLTIKKSFIQGKINRQAVDLSNKSTKSFVKTSNLNLKYRQSGHQSIKNYKSAGHQQQDPKQISDERQLLITPYCQRLSTVHFDKQNSLKNRVQPFHKIASISLHNRNKKQVQKVFIKRQSQIKPNSHSISSNLININKLANIQHPKQAQRIRFLKDLDKDYYKMLKSTLIMQKQNTRKNYQFLRTFKRAKYSSRDQILQEKRFQCSFSMLFTGKTNQFGDLAKKINQKNNKQINKNELKVIQSSRSFRSTSSLIGDKSQRSFKQMKQNAKKLKDKTDKEKSLLKKQSLSIQMKDVINLI